MNWAHGRYSISICHGNVTNVWSNNSRRNESIAEFGVNDSMNDYNTEDIERIINELLPVIHDQRWNNGASFQSLVEALTILLEAVILESDKPKKAVEAATMMLKEDIELIVNEPLTRDGKLAALFDPQGT